MKIEEIKPGWYRVEWRWRGQVKRLHGEHRHTLIAKANDMMNRLCQRDINYELERAQLESIMQEQDGSYYYEDALLKEKHGIPLTEDNLKAKQWYEAMMAEDRPDPWVEGEKI